jgi:hypothetical protein
LIFVSLLVAFILAEGISRFAMPVSPGARNLSIDSTKKVSITGMGQRLKPGLIFRQVSSEYDVQVSINAQGNRIPSTPVSPQVIFLGDSFTFGQGLQDEQTFPYIFHTSTGIPSANLGRVGSGTIGQVDILTAYLKEDGWRPKTVKLFMLAMSSSLTAGNDLTDNVVAYRPDQGLVGSLRHDERFNWRRFLLKNLNLVRLAQFSFGPVLRSTFSSAANLEKIDKALKITAVQLRRLDALASEYGFKLEIYVIHPFQDIYRNTHELTLAAIRGIAPWATVYGTGRLFADDPSQYYFRYDGHFNAEGSRRISDLLLDQLKLHTRSTPESE